MTKVWQFPDGTYLRNLVTTDNPDDAMRINSVVLFGNQLRGGIVDYDPPLIMTGAEILASAADKWKSKNSNPDRKSWANYLGSALGDLDNVKPNRKYKTDGEFSYFEEVGE